MTRILLADDHTMLRQSLRRALTERGLDVVGEAGDGDEAVAAAAMLRPDVVLMDLRMPGLDGVGATARITAEVGGANVLVLTTYDTDADILAAIEAGAVGYLLKDAPPEELATAVRTAAAGKSALSPAVALRLMDRLRVPDAALSRREIEVLQLVADGHSNLQISQQLFLSQATVKSHLAHIYTKLSVDSRTSAVAAATARGLIRR